MRDKIFLCADLDRTILPNGPHPESVQARPFLHAIALRPELTLAYVSGRDKRLLQEAITDYGLPVPDYAIGDVGTTIYAIEKDAWKAMESWHSEIASDWGGRNHDDLARLLDDLDALTLQEPEKQNTFKLSYYAMEDIDHDALLAEIESRLRPSGVQAGLIWSIDEQEHTGLLDILPDRATKYHAIRFLMAEQGFSEKNTVFAGDSGNDLPALTSGLQAVLVRNAQDEVRREAIASLKKQGLADRLYLACGNFRGMNGNYAAGVLEGLAHFIPATMAWYEQVSDDG